MTINKRRARDLFSGFARPVVLDVTLRDGGYLNSWEFNYENVEIAIRSASKAGADVIETGYLDDEPGLPAAASCPPKFLRWVNTLKDGSLIAAMIRPSVKKPEKVLNTRKQLVDLVRIPVNLKDVKSANALSYKCMKIGVPFTFNLTSITCYSEMEIEQAVEQLNKKSVVVYIADSRGALLTSKVREIVETIKCQWPGPVGFHAHNNLGMGIKNTEAAVQAGCEFIDGSLCGIGLGGRNLNLEDALTIAKKYRKDLHNSEKQITVKEKALGVDAPGDEMAIYRLSAERNIKMEWVQLFIEQLGLDLTEEVLKNIPNSVFFNPNELKPYIEKKYWEQLKW